MIFKSLVCSTTDSLKTTELALVFAKDTWHARSLIDRRSTGNTTNNLYKLTEIHPRLYHVASIPDVVQMSHTFTLSPTSKLWVGVHSYFLNKREMHDVYFMLNHLDGNSALDALGNVAYNGEHSSYIAYPISIEQVTPLYVLQLNTNYNAVEAV